MLSEIVEDAKSGMEKSLIALEVAFKKIRTGRATPSLLDSVKLEYYEKLTKGVVNAAQRKAGTKVTKQVMKAGKKTRDKTGALTSNTH